MKKLILTSTTVLCFALGTFAQDGFLKGFPQELSYEVHPKYSRPVKTETLNEARRLSDLIPGYPVNWITNYVLVEIMTTSNGKTMRAIGPNETLNAEQKNILNTADLASDIIIDVDYKHKNSVTDNMENNKLHVTMTVAPETDAEYIGGYQQMIKYLKENSLGKLPEKDPKKFQPVVIRFTVSGEGEVVNAKISRTSGDAKTDKLLLETINKMPRWKPAENTKGIKVNQEFNFMVGNSGC